MEHTMMLAAFVMVTFVFAYFAALRGIRDPEYARHHFGFAAYMVAWAVLTAVFERTEVSFGNALVMGFAFAAPVFGVAAITHLRYQLARRRKHRGLARMAP